MGTALDGAYSSVGRVGQHARYHVDGLLREAGAEDLGKKERKKEREGGRVGGRKEGRGESSANGLQ